MMALKGLVVLSLLRCIRAESTGKAFDAYFQRLVKITDPDGLDKVLDLITPDAAAVVTSGPLTLDTNLRDYYEGYRSTLKELSALDSSAIVLKVSGPTVTCQWTSHGVFKSGCEFNMHGFAIYDFNEAGHVTHMCTHVIGLDALEACAEGLAAPSRSFVPSPELPKGFLEFHRLNNGEADPGGIDRLVSHMGPGGMARVTLGAATMHTTFGEVFGSFKPALTKVATWRSHQQVLLKTEHAVSATLTELAVFTNGCVADMGGYFFVAFDDDGKVTHWVEHYDDLAAWDACAAQDTASRAAALPWRLA